MIEHTKENGGKDRRLGVTGARGEVSLGKGVKYGEGRGVKGGLWGVRSSH